MRFAATLVVAVFLPSVHGASSTDWTLVQSPHFQVYSQAGERDGRAALHRFEQLHALFGEVIAPEAAENLKGHGPVRIIGFQSSRDYAEFRLKPAADAYFLGGESADYIVMPSLRPEEFGIAAHEYAHLVMHSLGLQLAPWLSEGIAEFFSSVHISERGALIGDNIPARMLTLRRTRWLPLEQLLTMPADAVQRSERKKADIFYAESWALTQMLVLSPRYAPRLSELLRPAANEGLDLPRIYGKPLDVISADVHSWMQGSRSGIRLPGIPSINETAEVRPLNSYESRSIMAELLLASGELARAKAAYDSLRNERPKDASVYAALGKIALQQGDRSTARDEWGRALRLGIRDAHLCYQYAILAEDAGEATSDIRRALQLAIELKMDFDDARYKLGLLENNSGHYEAALEQFQTMRLIAPERAYGYWTAVSTALNETDRREEAQTAANKAMQYARNKEERTLASQLAYIAGTDLTVRMSRDAKGNLQMVTARKPHGSDDWNPFVEPDDRIVSVEGSIRDVECRSGKLTGFKIATSAAVIEVAVPDPSHVLIRGGTPEFMCGEEDPRKVVIQYAVSENRARAEGILRGLQFR